MRRRVALRTRRLTHAPDAVVTRKYDVLLVAPSVENAMISGRTGPEF